jgi:hypothetical protein
MQYGCDEAEKEAVLARCGRSDALWQFILGRTPLATARYRGSALLLLTLAALAASLAGLPTPLKVRLGLFSASVQSVADCSGGRDGRFDSARRKAAGMSRSRQHVASTRPR